VFEYVDRNLLEVLEDKPDGLDVTKSFPLFLTISVRNNCHANIPISEINRLLPQTQHRP